MANYNTFIVVDCNTRKPVLITSSARKASAALKTGFRVEVWNSNKIVVKIYNSNKSLLLPYIEAEREYIRQKQAAAEKRNKKRKAYKRVIAC